MEINREFVNSTLFWGFIIITFPYWIGCIIKWEVEARKIKNNGNKS